MLFLGAGEGAGTSSPTTIRDALGHARSFKLKGLRGEVLQSADFPVHQTDLLSTAVQGDPRAILTFVVVSIGLRSLSATETPAPRRRRSGQSSLAFAQGCGR